MAIALSAVNTSVILTLLFVSSVVSIVLGGIAWKRIVSLFLPFPVSWGAISTFYPILPFLSAFITNIIASRYQRRPEDSPKIRISSSSSSSGETVIDGDNNNADSRDIVANNTTTRSLSNSLYPFITSAIDHLLTLLPTVIATLAATYVAPSDNSCHLEQTWQTFYRNKDVLAIRSIQDQLQCCGLRSTRDRAWPFKDKTHGDTACETTTGYRHSCLQPWSEQERRVAVLVLVAAVLGWGIKMSINSLTPRNRNRGIRPNAWINRVHIARNAPTSTGPRLLPFSDHQGYENGDSGREEAAAAGAASDDDDGNPNGTTTNPLVNPDSRDLNSPEGRDLAGGDPWRENV